MEFDERLINSSLTSEDVEVENSLRPKSIEEYVGQEKIKNNLNVFVSTAKERH